MSISRRKFLIRSVQCVLAAGFLPGLSACAERPVREQELTGDGYGGLVDVIGRQRADIIRYASLAPSGHNVQPWTVTIKSADNWIIGSAEERWLSEVDPRNRELALSIGAFLENLVIAAQANGFEVNIRLLADNPFDPELLSLELVNGKRVDYPLKRLFERRTLRTGFKNEYLDPEDILYLTDADDNFFYYPPESPGAEWLAMATVAAMEHQVKRDNVQQELARWIRWSEADAAKYRNGLTPESMDITGLAGWYVKNFYGESDVLGKDFRKATVERAKKQVAESGGWIVIRSDNERVGTLIETGRRFERMFLKAKTRSVGVHPMSQVLEERPWVEDVRKILGLESKPQFILRVGYTREYPLPVSLRMPPGEITYTSE